MIQVKPFNQMIKNLRSIIKIEKQFPEAMLQALYLHSLVHVTKVSDAKQKTYEDELWEGLSDTGATIGINKKGRTVVYGLWHATRIEDITVNLLINNNRQIFDKHWGKKINSSIIDTGNQLSSREIAEFSKNIKVNELRNYRLSVGRNTQKTLRKLQFADLKRKFSPASLARIFQEKAVAQHPDAAWLVDFWGKKNVAGIIFMPLTRHILVHINESFQAKSQFLKAQ